MNILSAVSIRAQLSLPATILRTGGAIILAVWLSGISVPVVASAANAHPPVKLFSSHPVQVKAGVYGKSAVAAELNIRGLAPGAKRLTLVLPGGEEILLERSYLERRGKNDLAWFGRVSDTADSEVVITFRRGLVYGRLRIGAQLYELSTSKARQLRVEQLEPELFPQLEGDTVVAPANEAAAGLSEQNNSVATSADATTTIDLLAVYSLDALSAAGSAGQMEAIVQAAVDAANSTFVNSNMTIRYRLVHVAGINYSTAGTTGDDLPWLRGDPEVASLRTQYGADMVSLIVNTVSSCGTGYVQRTPGSGFASSAFQVTDIDCAVGNLTFAHEHGHNLGMEHNPENSGVGTDPSQASYPWSFAHYIDGSYRTMMSYSAQCNSGCPRAQQISNPGIIYNGAATGIAGLRDNAQTGELTGPIVANFFNTVLPNDDSIVLGVLGDFGDGSSDSAAVASLVNSWTPNFIITGGDNRYGSGIFDGVVGQFYCNYLSDVASGSFCNGGNSGSNAFFPAPGNHDYNDGGGINEYLGYFNLPGAGIAGSGTSGSERYYDFIKGSVHFFALDSQAALSSSTEMNAQKAWLQAQLAASTTPWQVVFFHHAAFSSANHGSESAMQWPFAVWGADAVIGAHDHTYERLNVDGIPYFVNGLGGRSIYSFNTPAGGSQFRYNGDYGAMRITADSTQMTFEFVNTTGAVIDNYSIPTLSANVLSARIASSNDDVEERSSDSVIDMTSSDIELGDDPGHNGDQTLGLRFNGLDIPRGAIIRSASLEFTVDEIDTGLTSVIISAQASDNAPAFTAIAGDVSGRALSNVSVSWDIQDWNTIGVIRNSPDLSAVVQEIVDRQGWTPGNSMAFIISGSGSRTAESFDGSPGNAALLRVEFDLAPPAAGTLDITIATGGDDVEEQVSSGNMYINSSDLEIVDDPAFNGDQTLGLRFRALNIPRGASIDRAYLEFTAKSADNVSTDIVIQAQASDNSPAFGTTAYDLSRRSLNSASVLWSIPAWNSIGESHRSPDISALIQGVTDRSGWFADNNLVLVISGAGTRSAYSYEGNAASAALLHVEYSDNGSPNLAPAAAFSASSAGLTVSFSDESVDSDGTITNWAWDFGDGGSSVAQSPGYSYSTGGNYAVTLTVTDNSGASDSISQLVTVTEPDSPPVADFSVTVTDLSADFSDLSTDNTGTIVSWLWDFGDSSSSNLQNPSHSYSVAGAYTVVLTVTDDAGATGSAARDIVITDTILLPPAAPDNLIALVQTTGKGKKRVITGVLLSWADNSDNETKFLIERCKEEGKGKNKSCLYSQIGNVGENITEFPDMPGTGTFKYRVRAGNAQGRSGYSNQVKT